MCVCMCTCLYSSVCTVSRLYVTSVVSAAAQECFKTSTKFYESVILRNILNVPNFSSGNISVWKVGMNKTKL